MNISSNEAKSKRIRVSDYLEEIGGIDKLLLEKNSNVACIIAGTGSGKSYWVKHHLTQSGRVLFVTSRKSKVLQDLNDPSLKCHFSNNLKDNTNIVCTNFALYLHIKELTNNTSKEEGLKKVDAFIDRFDYIVFDESHSFVCDSVFSSEVFNIAVFCAYCAVEKKKKTILLSATIEPIKFFTEALSKIFKKMPKSSGIVSLDLRKKCIYVLPSKIRVIEKNENKNAEIDKLLDSGENIIYFMNYVGKDSNSSEETENNKKSKKIETTIQQEYEHLIKYGLKKEEIAVIVSKEKQKQWDIEHNCKQEKDPIFITENNPNKLTFNEWVRDYIAKNEEIPAGIRVILCSATLNEGISINNEKTNVFKYIITDAHYLPTLIQQMGRLRNNLQEFWIINNAKQHRNFLDETEAKLVRSKSKTKYSFLDLLNEYTESMADYSERNDFIYWIKNKKGFSLIEYVYLTHRFEFNNLKYNMINQSILSEEKATNGDFKNMRKWQYELKKFATTNDIVFVSSNMDRITKELLDIAKIKKHISSIIGKKFHGDEWKIEKGILKNLDLGATEKTISAKLKVLNLPFVFNKSDKFNKGNYTYWFSENK